VAVATGVNAAVYATVDLVDNLTHLKHPTERSADRRVWGPYRNVDGKHLTVRIEVDRTTTATGKPRWLFCLHAARDAAFTGDGPKSCDDPDKGGLEKVLWGHNDLTSKNDSLRSGRGVVDIEGRILVKLGAATDGGHMKIQYDFSKGGDDKQLHVNHVAPATLGTPSRVSDYDYGKVDKQIDMTFQFQKDVVNAPGAAPGPSLDETVTLSDSWRLDGPGRADGNATDGDLAAGEVYAWTECWNGSHQRTYYKFTFSRHPILNKEEGDVSACPL
jgi:hypothetical protein